MLITIRDLVQQGTSIYQKTPKNIGKNCNSTSLGNLMTLSKNIIDCSIVSKINQRHQKLELMQCFSIIFAKSPHAKRNILRPTLILNRSKSIKAVKAYRCINDQQNRKRRKSIAFNDKHSPLFIRNLAQGLVLKVPSFLATL